MAFTDEQIRKARQTDLVSYLQRENEMAREAGQAEPYTLVQDGGQVRVSGYGGLLVTQNMWNQRSTKQGGNTVDFIQQFEKRPFREAVERVLANDKGFKQLEVAKKEFKPKEPFLLPEANDTFKRVIAYLTKTRGLDPEIVLKEIKNKNLYEDKQYHNAVFVGKDQEGEPRWAQKRTTLSERKIVLDQVGSDPRYPFFYGNRHSITVIVTESPIEALSYASMIKIHGNDPEKTAILALGGVHDTALKQYLSENPHVKNIVSALNNDRASKPHEVKGHEASEMIQKKYESRYYVRKVFPKGNDWNDDLRSIRAQELEKNPVVMKEKGVEDQVRDYAKMKAKQRSVEKGPTRVRTR